MALRNRIIKPVLLGPNGVNFYDAPEWLADGEAQLMKNCYWRHGLVGKNGSVKKDSHEVVADKAITAVHRFYYGASSRQLLAAAGTKVRYLNEPGGDWTDLKTGLTDGAEVVMRTWTALDKCYIVNGADQPFSWDGTTAADVTALPVSTNMILPYRDRLLFIDNNYGLLRWTAAAYDTAAIITTAQAVRVLGGGAITVLAPHAIAQPQEGIITYVFVGTPGSVSLFSGTDLDPASSTFDARLDYISSTVGCYSPETTVLTPKGTFFLGSDHQVYWLPFGSPQLVLVGHKIISHAPGRRADEYGLESIPSTYYKECAAVYHDGFYKLTFPSTGHTVNNYQYWLDVDNLVQDPRGRWGPWFGPMLGMNISSFTVLNGVGDDGSLVGGDHSAHGYVYTLNDQATYGDDGENIATTFLARPEVLAGSSGLDAAIVQTEVELLTTRNDVLLSFYDTTGAVGSTYTILAGAGGGGGGTAESGYWGDDFWGAGQYWGDVVEGTGGGGALYATIRQLYQYYNSPVQGRALATQVDYESSVDRLEIGFIQHEAKPVKRTFAVRR